jgi:outer membrane murein-binding lipoprotein Lpp
MSYILSLIKPVWLYIILIAAIALLTVKIKILESRLHGCTNEAHAIAATLDFQNAKIKELSEEEKNAQQRYDAAEREAKREASKAQKEAIELAQEKVPVKCEDAISWAVDVSKRF